VRKPRGVQVRVLSRALFVDSSTLEEGYCECSNFGELIELSSI